MMKRQVFVFVFIFVTMTIGIMICQKMKKTHLIMELIMVQKMGEQKGKVHNIMQQVAWQGNLKA